MVENILKITFIQSSYNFYPNQRLCLKFLFYLFKNDAFKITDLISILINK